MSNFFSKLKSIFFKSDNDTFIGLIDENGVSNIRFGDKCMMTFKFVAYIKNDEELMEEEVIILKEIPSIDHTIKGLEPLTIVKISGHQELLHHQINLQSVLNTNLKHEELTDILSNRLNPVTYDSSELGTFTLNRNVDWFEKKFRWNENEIDLCLSCKVDEIQELEITAIQICNNAIDWERKLKSKISEELLPLKNESWIDENELPITESDFLSRISLENITINKDGEFEAWFNDGDAFWGHSINVRANINGTIDYCEIQG
ncbi:DUF2262 domain-containing protein [Flammeovirga sp. OC4]|uniref:DUF2262 domain-containing protein n=1 Tax=Flammeovirga sp. OC4 TaxID=1382345 RepID=UPI0005C441F2|nr:DUF2262 domain-containing protein [Flammeovirga sp. OC4]